jgi:RNA polymerase sigma-70 factor (ECF subfamily)
MEAEGIMADDSARDELRERAVRTALGQRYALTALAFAITRDQAAAEDISQEVLLLVMRQPERLLDARSAPAWLREVTRRTALEQLRKTGRRPGIVDPQLLDALESVWESAEAGWPQETRNALRKCLAGLGDKARQIVHERYENNLTGARLAEQMGLTTDSAYATLSRVHRALAECIRRRMASPEGEA